MEDTFKPIYDQSVIMAKAVGESPSAPRITGRMTHRSNAQSADDPDAPPLTPEQIINQYYRLNVVIPFLDHVIVQLDTRFSGKKLDYSFHGEIYQK